MSYKLNWSVKKNPDGSIARRSLPGDEFFHLDYIDVEWTYPDGFPEDTIAVPVTHPPDIQYEIRKVGKRDVLKDQLSVTASVTDSTVCMMLDERRKSLAKALKLEL